MQHLAPCRCAGHQSWVLKNKTYLGQKRAGRRGYDKGPRTTSERDRQRGPQRGLRRRRCCGERREVRSATSAVEAGAYDEGSNGDEAGASAARCAYAASVAANNNKAAASTARRARAVNSAPMHGRGKEIGKGTHKRAPLTIRPRRAPQGTRTQHAPPPPLGAARGHSGPMHGRGRRHRQRGLRRGLWQQQGRGEHLEAWVCKRCLRG